MVLVRTYSVLARSTPETAFAYVSDVARRPEWSQHNMKVMRAGVGPLAVGSRYDTVGDARGKPQAARVEVTRLQPPTGFSFTATEKKSTASGSASAGHSADHGADPAWPPAEAYCEFQNRPS